jgi:hypothetical protein
MHESSSDIESLQSLLDVSFANAGEHLRSIFKDESRLDARQVIALLDDIFEMHLATATATGAPLVAPIDGIFYQGKVWFGFPAQAVRADLVRRDPRVSASYTRGKSFAFIIHGTCREVPAKDPLFKDYSTYLRDLYVEAYGPGWEQWYEQQKTKPGEEYNAWIEPRRMYVKQ